MPHENVEIVRRGWGAWLRGDFPGLFRMFDEEAVWDMSSYPDWPESAYHGREGVERFLKEWLEVWDDYEMGIEDVILAPDGRVVTLFWQRGKGRDSGLPMELQTAQIATVRDGKVTRLDNYLDRAEALQVVGLSE
jgi:ketosteroid isomerase-like protein